MEKYAGNYQLLIPSPSSEDVRFLKTLENCRLGCADSKEVAYQLPHSMRNTRKCPIDLRSCDWTKFLRGSLQMAFQDILPDPFPSLIWKEQDKSIQKRVRVQNDINARLRLRSPKSFRRDGKSVMTNNEARRESLF